MNPLPLAIVTLVLAACTAAPGSSVSPSAQPSATIPDAASAAPAATPPATSEPSASPSVSALPEDSVWPSVSYVPPTPGPCPGSPMTVGGLAGAHGGCLDAGTIHVRGWLSPPWGVGGLNIGIEPAWLGEWFSDLVLWQKPHPADGCFTDTDCVWEWAHVNPGSGVDLGSPERWVELTGHYRDSLSTTCHYVGTGDHEGHTDPVADCRGHFVVTAVSDIAAPG
jgi:hypothetical protein